MTCLVTGATGLLGNNLVRLLLKQGQTVRVLVRPQSDPRPLAGLEVQRVIGDVTDQAAVRQAVRGARLVFHCAAHVHLGWRQWEEHRAINVEGTRQVATAALDEGARLVHVSAINALGLGRLDQPADEDSALEGIVPVPYVVTKRQAEEVVLDLVRQGLDAVIVNPGCMFGPWDWKPSSGKMLLAVTRFAPFAPLGAVSFCDARDVAEGTLAAARLGRTGRRYILAGHNLSYWQAWRQMARLAGKRGPILPMGPLFRAISGPVLDLHTWWTGREGDANSAVLRLGRQEHCFSSRRAQEELGYQIRPFDQTLQDTWDWFRSYGYV